VHIPSAFELQLRILHFSGFHRLVILNDDHFQVPLHLASTALATLLTTFLLAFSAASAICSVPSIAGQIRNLSQTVICLPTPPGVKYWWRDIVPGCHSRSTSNDPVGVELRVLYTKHICFEGVLRLGPMPVSKIHVNV
jgi:hypothetical protein